MVDETAIGERFRALAGELDERRRRLWAAAEARSCGRGGIAAVARATGISEATIRKGLRELEAGERLEPGRVRRRGGGRKRLVEKDPTLLGDLERLVDSDSRGDPEQPLRWTAKSVRTLAEGLRKLGHQVSFRTVARLLRGLGYSLQANAKTREGRQHPDRDQQFAHINATVGAALEAGEPVISVDTKKKELIGDFKNGGREWRPAGEPVEVRTHDFKDPELGKAIPYGIYDLAHDEGWVSVGIDHDTAQFAAASIQAWWEHLGQQRFPDATTLTITADCGGSNGNRTRLWKTELQRLADHTGLQVRVCHFPPATSKWNKIEHRLFSFISQNWRGKPLESRQVIISLIAATTTRTGLKVYARLDERSYPDKIKITDDQLAAVQLEGDPFHPDWNYTIKPRR
ncbi:MAG: ISAzo13 family transposase [Actinobacteria bacterium]|nr:ISAzo13 family transposase [Actinomycetota bacterium]MCA1701178.1 ISAzo13 family transposase [Actinomycetota bacterium]